MAIITPINLYRNRFQSNFFLHCIETLKESSSFSHWQLMSDAVFNIMMLGFFGTTTTSSFSDAPLTNFLAELKGLTFNNVKKSRKTLNGKVLCCKGLLLRNFFCHAKGWKRKTFAKVLSCSSLIHICLVQVEVYKSVLIDWLADEKRTE